MLKIIKPIKSIVISVIIFIKNNWIYIVWLLFYVALFGFITRGISMFFYLITVLLAFSQYAEGLWRMVMGVRPLRIRSEEKRLLPLFNEVYAGAISTNPKLSEDIELYIKEDMTINAFAFGKNTMVLTRGSIEQLNDEGLKGLMAHEFGHFSYRHTEALLLSMVGNLPISFVGRKLADIKNRYSSNLMRRTLFTGIFIVFFDLIYYIFRSIEFVGELILMYSSREHEYIADDFACKSGFGKETRDVLKTVYGMSVSEPGSVREQFKSTHPHITLRIQELERFVK